VLSTQRVNRAALPHMRKQRSGLLVWVSSSSVAGGTPPYLSPYFAAKAGIDAIAVSYARELALWGIETSIVVPGAFTGGTNHFAHAGHPADTARAAEYNAGPYANYANKIMEAFAAIVPADADAAAVGDAIAKIIDMPFGKRPFRVHIDPTHDGAEVSFAVIDRMRTEMLHRVGLDELLGPAKIAPAQPTNQIDCEAAYLLLDRPLGDKPEGLIGEWHRIEINPQDARFADLWDRNVRLDQPSLLGELSCRCSP
jgi:hypothetical protein